MIKLIYYTILNLIRHPTSTDHRPRSRKGCYFSREHNKTCVGKSIWAWRTWNRFTEDGEIGLPLGIYLHVPRLAKGAVDYGVLAPINKSRITLTPARHMSGRDPRADKEIRPQFTINK